MKRGSVFGFVALVIVLATVSSAPIRAQGASETSPLVSPVVDMDVTYDATGPDGQIYRQRMRWNAAHWQQRLDIASSDLVMLTDYRAHRLSVIDPHAKTFTVSGAPDAQFTPPGTPARGQWQRGTSDQVAGQGCTHWRSVDTDGQEGDFCYSDKGVLLSAQRNGVMAIRAVAYAETPQEADVFREPDGFREVSALRLAHPGGQ